MDLRVDHAGQDGEAGAVDRARGGGVHTDRGDRLAGDADRSADETARCEDIGVGQEEIVSHGPVMARTRARA